MYQYKDTISDDELYQNLLPICEDEDNDEYVEKEAEDEEEEEDENLVERELYNKTEKRNSCYESCNTYILKMVLYLLCIFDLSKKHT